MKSIELIDRYFKIYPCQKDRFYKELSDSELEFYWDYNSELSDDQIKKIFDDDVCELENNIYDMNIEYIFDLKKDAVIAAFAKVGIDVNAFYGTKEIISKYVEKLDEINGVDINIKELFRLTGDVNTRVIVFTNYDALPSHFGHGYGEYSYENSALKGYVDLLYLNPATLKKEMIERGWNPIGKWPNLKYRNGKEYVSYEDFVIELENNMGYSLLNFFGKFDLNEFLEGRPKKVVIRKGSYCGLLDHVSGGGSIWEMELLRDMTLDLDKEMLKGTPKDVWYELIYDGNPGYGYGADEIAGLTSTYWSHGKIEIQTYKKESYGNN